MRGAPPCQLLTWRARDGPGFKAKRRVVIPGLFNQLVAYGLRITPRRISLPFVKQVIGRRRAT